MTALFQFNINIQAVVSSGADRSHRCGPALAEDSRSLNMPET
jgi:hypothetical protein